MRIAFVGRVVLVIVALSSLAVSAPAWAQDTLARIITANPDSSYEIEIGGRRLLAIPEGMARRAILTDLERNRLQREVAYRDSLLTLYRSGQRFADSTVAHCKHYAGELDSLYRGYRDLAEGYRRLSRDAWLTFDAGLGASGSDTSPAVLLGLGLRRIRLWGFFQEGNSGGFLGASFRLF